MRRADVSLTLATLLLLSTVNIHECRHMPLRMFLERLEHQNELRQAGGSESEATSHALTNAVNIGGIPIQNTVSGGQAHSTSGSHAGNFQEHFGLGGFGLDVGLDSEKVGTGVGGVRQPGQVGFHIGGFNLGFSNKGGLFGSQNTQTQTGASASAVGAGSQSSSQSNTQTYSHSGLGGLLNVQNTLSNSAAHSSSQNGISSASSGSNSIASQTTNIPTVVPNPGIAQTANNVRNPNIVLTPNVVPNPNVVQKPSPIQGHPQFQQPGFINPYPTNPFLNGWVQPSQYPNQHSPSHHHDHGPHHHDHGPHHHDHGYPQQHYPHQQFPYQPFPQQQFPQNPFIQHQFPQQPFLQQQFPFLPFPQQQFPFQQYPNQQQFPQQPFPNQQNVNQVPPQPVTPVPTQATPTGSQQGQDTPVIQPNPIGNVPTPSESNTTPAPLSSEFLDILSNQEPSTPNIQPHSK